MKQRSRKTLPRVEQRDKRISVRCNQSLSCGWYGSRVWRAGKKYAWRHALACPWCGHEVVRAVKAWEPSP